MKVIMFALLLMVTTSVIGTNSAQAQIQDPTQDIPVVGSFINGTFAGTLDIVRFTRVGNQIFAVGSLTGTLTDLAGNTVGSVTGTQIQLPVSQIIGSCEILHLELGPLDLDLLGLVVHLDRVVLDISAEAGPGNLLGNLLCAITHLLDGPGSIIAIINLLNQILGALG